MRQGPTFNVQFNSLPREIQAVKTRGCQRGIGEGRLEIVEVTCDDISRERCWILNVGLDACLSVMAGNVLSNEMSCCTKSNCFPALDRNWRYISSSCMTINQFLLKSYFMYLIHRLNFLASGDKDLKHKRWISCFRGIPQDEEIFFKN